MGRPRRPQAWIGPAIAAMSLSLPASADNFVKVFYDTKTDELVVTMVYQGTNPDHNFSLRWGDCLATEPGNSPGVTAEVLDDQWEDPAQQEFQKTTRFALSDMPCGRPAIVTLRTAPRFFYSLTIPG